MHTLMYGPCHCNEQHKEIANAIDPQAADHTHV
jgi:hypothetical protein